MPSSRPGQGWRQSLHGPWVPAPGRTSNNTLMDNMVSPLRSRLSEMDGLASVLADSGLSVAGDSSPDSRYGGPVSSVPRPRHSDRRPARPRRKPGKSAGAQRSRRAAPAEDSVRVRRRPAPAASGGRPARAGSGEGAAGGQTGPAGGDADRGTTGTPVTGSRTQEPPPERAPRSEAAPPPAGPGSLQEVLERFLWAKQQAGAAADLMASLRQAVEGGQQEPSSQAEPGVTQTPAGSHAPPLAPTPVEPTSTKLTRVEPALTERTRTELTRGYTGPGTATSGEQGDSENLYGPASHILPHTNCHTSVHPTSHRVSHTVPHTIPHTASQSAFEPAFHPASDNASHSASHITSHSVSDTASRVVTRTVTDAVTHSSLLATSCSLPARPCGGGGRGSGWTGSADSGSSAESASVLPAESRSQLLRTDREGGVSRHSQGDGRQSPDWRSVSASETALGGAPPAGPASQRRHTDSLRRQYQRQRDKLRRLQQTNYVLNLAVDGQDKTIRTLSTQLEDTKAALLQEISHQAVPTAGRRGDGTQTGPSLTALRPARGDSVQPPADSTRTEHPPLRPAGAGQTDSRSQPSAAPAPPTVEPTGARRPGTAAEGPGWGQTGTPGEGPAEVQRERGLMVETATSPEPEPEPEPEPRTEPGHQSDGRAAGPMESGNERNRREVQRLLLALEAKERELAILRAEGANLRREALSAANPKQKELWTANQRHEFHTPTQRHGELLANEAFLSTPLSGITRPVQVTDGAWPGIPGSRVIPGSGSRSPDPCRQPAAWSAVSADCRVRSTEVFRRPPAEDRPRRRHSFTAPQTRGGEWRHMTSEPARAQGSLNTEPVWAQGSLTADPARAQRSLLAEFDREAAVVGPPPAAVRTDVFEAECQQLQQAVVEGRSKITRLEEEVFELKCARRRQQDAELESAAAGCEELKRQLASSVEERRQLQERLTAAETSGSELRSQLQLLREEVQNKETLLSQTTQHLEDRIAQVAAMGRELESVRSEAAQQQRSAAAQLDRLLAQTARLEETAAELQRQNRQLGQERDEAGRLAESERRLRERVSDLQERLEQSTNTARMLENYIRFLKTSYSKLFGTGEPPGESADDHGTARSGLFDLTGK